MDGIGYTIETLKLVSFSNGNLQLHEKTLQTFVNQIKPKYGDLPVAVLSIIGPPRSGKSFYTNLLIKFLQNRSDDWLTDLSSYGSLSTESLHGFAFGDVDFKNILPNDSESGIYIWPQTFITKKYDGQLLLFILHIHEFSLPNEHERASYFLQLLLSLLCSRITEIKWSFNKCCGFDFRAIESPITRSIVPTSLVCRSIVNLYRLLPRPIVQSQVSKEDLHPKTSDGEAEYLGEYGSSYKAVYIDESLEPLHNEYGTLDITVSMHSQIDHAIKSIGDRNHTFPRLDENLTPVTLSGIQKYFCYCVSIVNECIRRHTQTEFVKSQVSLKPDNAENLSPNKADKDMEQSNTEIDTVAKADNETASITQCDAEIGNQDQDDKETTRLGQSNTEIDRVDKADNETASITQCDAEISNQDKDDKETTRLGQSNTEATGTEQTKAEIEKTGLLEEQKHKEYEEQKRKEYEEQKRIEYEKTLFKTVVDATEFLELLLKDELDTWLKDTLNIPTVKFGQGLYDRCIEKMLETKFSDNLSNDEMKKVQELAEEKTKDAKEKLERINKIITTFHSQVKKLMRSEVYINPEIFPNKLRNKIEDLDKDVKQCAQMGCNKLASIYIKQNESIVTYETKLLLAVSQDFRKIYNEKMSKYTSMHHYSPKQIFDLHYELMVSCMKNFRSMYRYAEVTDTFIGLEAEKDLVNHLSQEYDLFKQLNLQKLKKLQTETMEVISKQKTAYCSQIENILLQSPNGVPEGSFETQHFTIMNDVVRNMKSEIKKAIGKSEPTHGSVTVIMNNISLFWANFSSINFEKLNCPKDTLNKPISKQDVNIDLNKLTSNSLPISGPSKSCFDKTLKNADSIVKQTTLSPIIFTLSLSRIGTYIIYKNKVRTFGRCETIVAVTADDLLVCGNDDTSEIDKSKGHKVWNLSDYLLSAQNLEMPEMLTIGETTYPIRTELLLGFLLYFLKQRVENECRGSATECVITIPFWFTSTQRQQVKDSGKCAGFLETHLVNENSTAALQYCWASNDQGVNDIVVLSENSGIVYSTIYSYNTFHKVVKMTGCASFYDYNDFVNSKSYAENDNMIQKIKATYETSQKMADFKLRLSNKNKTVIVLSESDAWKEILLTFGKSIEKMEKVCGFNESLISNGAVFLGANINLHREKMKDWISASIFKTSDTQKEKIIQAQKGFIISTTQQNHSVHDYFYWQEVEAIYYQKGINGQEIEIGRLKWSSRDSRYTTIYLEISEEGIVSTTLNHPSTSGSLTWCTQHLNETQIKIHLSLFESFEHTKKQIVERDSKKQDLMKQGNILLDRIENAAFRSSLARDMALKQIKESLEMLNHPKIKAAEIDRQLETFPKI